MDVWLQITRKPGVHKSLTLVVTPFKKGCTHRDSQFYMACPGSSQCIKRHLFCDGRVNCGNQRNTDEDGVFCQGRADSGSFVPNIPVIVIVIVVILVGIMLLYLLLSKFTRRLKQRMTEEEPGEAGPVERRGGAQRGGVRGLAGLVGRGEAAEARPRAPDLEEEEEEEAVPMNTLPSNPPSYSEVVGVPSDDPPKYSELPEDSIPKL